MSVRPLLLAAVALLAVCPLSAPGEGSAAPRPVSVQELSLLLRNGYTGDEVLKEVAGRPLLAPLDAVSERTLRDAGADARTIAALRDDHRVASTTEAEDARQRQLAAESHRPDANPPAAQPKPAPRRDEAPQQIATALHGKLVAYKDGRLVPYDETALAGKKLFLLYASASWCGPCRQLTPKLVEFYQKFAPAHPEFEVVLLPEDRSAADMENYMRTEKMPWAALAYDQMAKQPGLAAVGKDGIPRMVLIDSNGKKLADNFEDGKFVSPNKVIDVLLAQTGTKQAGR